MAKWIAAIALTFVVGLGSGYWFKSKLEQAEKVELAEVVIHATLEEAVDSSKKSTSIETEIQKSDKRIEAIKGAVVKRLEAQKEHDEQTSCPAYVFDADVVGLLNNARRNAADSAPGSHEEIGTPAAIGVEEFVENDLEVVRMYHELAKRHDELVDYVQSKMNKQAQ